MSQFMFLFRGGGYASTAAPSPSELQAHLARWTAWTDGLVAAGKLVAAHGLTHPPTGKTVRGHEKSVTDGPYAESKDLVSGAVIVEAASLADATELAKGCPIFEYDGSVEVRPVLVPPAR
jgi:hypothetical protein